MRARTLAALYAVPLVGAAVGYVISATVSAPPGAEHSCPALLPGMVDSPYRCAYPPNTARWGLEWTAGGLLVGVALAIVTWAVLRTHKARRRRAGASSPETAGDGPTAGEPR